MIRVSLGNALLVPMFINMGIVILCAIFYTIRRHRWSSKAIPDELYECSMCGHVYADRRETRLSRCPRCGVLNEPVRP
jgi:hypothetical protein